MKKIISKILLVVLIASVAFAFAGCGQSTNPAKIQKAGKIVLGTSADYPPYEFINDKDEIIGFDIEIAKEIAKDLGVELVIQNMDFDGLLAALVAGNIDFVIAGMTPDEERLKSVDFSKIYYTAKQTVLVRTEDKSKYNAIADLKSKKVGAQKGAIQEEIVAEQLKDSTPVLLGKIPDLIMELKTKKIDGLVIEDAVANAYISKNADLSISAVKLDQDTAGSAVAVKKGNKELVEAFNKTLDRLISSKTIDKFVVEANEAVTGK